MGRVLLLVFDILAVSTVIYLMYRGWKKASISDKLDRADEINQDHATVTEFNKNNPNISDKAKDVNEFKKKDY